MIFYYERYCTNQTIISTTLSLDFANPSTNKLVTMLVDTANSRDIIKESCFYLKLHATVTAGELVGRGMHPGLYVSCKN